MPYLGRRVGPLLLWDFDGLFCEPEGHRDPRTPSVQGLFVWEGGGLFCPLAGLFTLHVFVPAPGFFFWPSRPAPQWIARCYVRNIGMTNSEHEVRELL